MPISADEKAFIYEFCEYRRCVAMFVRQPESGLIFAAERLNESGAWQIPQGGAEANEEDYEAALRELHEETGIYSVKLLKCTENRYRYDFPPRVIAKRKRHHWRNYKGQTVRFFLFEFLGEESEINLNTVPEFVEFSRWKWMTAEDIVGQMVEFKKDAMERGARELGIVAS